MSPQTNGNGSCDCGETAGQSYPGIMQEIENHFGARCDSVGVPFPVETSSYFYGGKHVGHGSSCWSSPP